MEYYYCPSLLKLLRYLWVSAAVRTRISFFFSSRLRPALLPGSVWSAVSLFSLRNGGFFKEEGVLGKGWGLIWEAEGAHRRGRSPAQGGSVGTAATPPVLGHPSSPRKNRKNKGSVSDLSRNRHFFDLQDCSLF